MGRGFINVGENVTNSTTGDTLSATLLQVFFVAPFIICKIM